MGEKSAVDWLYDPFLDQVGATINPWWGCERVSPACNNCYIFRQPPLRMRLLTFDKAAIGGKTDIIFAPRSVLLGPIRRRKPLLIFAESLGDLWHGQVNIMRTAEVFAVALLAPQHIFITSTKRTRRQRNWLRSPRFAGLVAAAVEMIAAEFRAAGGRYLAGELTAARAHLAGSIYARTAMAPVRNVWIGTTVEDNQRAAERIPLLQDTPAAVRWISCEPLTSEDDDPLDLGPWLAGNTDRLNDRYGGIHWAVFGGESGPPARATALDTAPAVGLRRIDIGNLTAQVQVATANGARVFVKQLGEPWAVEHGSATKKGNDPAEWPAELRVRRYPAQLARRALDLDPGNEAARADLADALVTV